MATATKICKVCGREYEYCHTFKRVAGVFRWQDVACSAEHGEIYLARVLAARNISSAPCFIDSADNKSPAESKMTGVDYIDDDEEDELFETDFEDDDE